MKMTSSSGAWNDNWRRQNHAECDETLRAVVTRIIPPDDFPDAWEAGVGVYLQRLLTGDARDLAPWLAAGLNALDAEAHDADQCPFAGLPVEQQDCLLDRVERGDVRAMWPVAPREFMTTLIRLAHEGYYSDPENGGNRHAVSWEMVGFDPRLPREERP